jgi:hypothetical protein
MDGEEQGSMILVHYVVGQATNNGVDQQRQ